MIMGPSSPLPGTAGSQEGLQGEPLPSRLLPGEARSSYERLAPGVSRLGLPSSTLPPPAPRHHQVRQEKQSVYLHLGLYTRVPQGACLCKQACSFLAREQAGGRGLGTLGLSLGASTPSPHAGAWTWRSRPSPRAKPASGWRLQGQKTRVKSHDASEAPDDPLDEPLRAAHPSRLWRPS